MASVRRLFIRIMSALSIATSVPAPMAIPTSAAARAGASLIPSPTIATLRPSFFNRCISFSLSSGSTSAITWSMCSCRFTASAVLLLSPVSITTSIFILWNTSIAVLEDSFTVSATAITASSFPSFAKSKGVFPSPENRSIFSIRESGRVTLLSSINPLFPARY